MQVRRQAATCSSYKNVSARRNSRKTKSCWLSLRETTKMASRRMRISSAIPTASSVPKKSAPPTFTENLRWSTCTRAAWRVSPVTCAEYCRRISKCDWTCSDMGRIQRLERKRKVYLYRRLLFLLFKHKLVKKRRFLLKPSEKVSRSRQVLLILC